MPKDARRIHGVGLAVKTDHLQSTQESSIAIDEGLTTLRFPLAKHRLATFVRVHAPTFVSSDDVRDRFYDTLYSTSEVFRQTTKSCCWAISMPGSAEIMTYGKASLVIMVLAT